MAAAAPSWPRSRRATPTRGGAPQRTHPTDRDPARSMGGCSGEPTRVGAAVRVVLRRRRRTTRRYAVVAVAVAVAVAAEATAAAAVACLLAQGFGMLCRWSEKGRHPACVDAAGSPLLPGGRLRLASAAFVGEDAASCGSRLVSLVPVGGSGA